jgi:hypothetical protein
LKRHTNIIEKIARDTARFRQQNSTVKVPQSIFEAARSDTESIYTFNSTATSTYFTFDDIIVNSAAYRRAITSSKEPDSLTNLRMPKSIKGVESIPASIRQKLTFEEVISLRALQEEIEEDLSHAVAENNSVKEERIKEREYREKELKDVVNGYQTKIDRLSREHQIECEKMYRTHDIDLNKWSEVREKLEVEYKLTTEKLRNELDTMEVNQENYERVLAVKEKEYASSFAAREIELLRSTKEFLLKKISNLETVLRDQNQHFQDIEKRLLLLSGLPPRSVSFILIILTRIYRRIARY